MYAIRSYYVVEAVHRAAVFPFKHGFNSARAKDGVQPLQVGGVAVADVAGEAFKAADPY